MVDLLCILCGRIRTYRELLMIFFHDKNWFHTHLSKPLELVQEEDEDEEEGESEGTSRVCGIRRMILGSAHGRIG